MTVAMAERAAAEIDMIQPWPGLDAFTEELSRFFYGRDAEADELFRHVQRDVVAVLFGRSGLGKTSLLQAGLFPRLRKAGFLPILVRLDYSAEAPSLVAQVKAGIERECSAAKIHEVSWSTAEESLWGCFHRVDRRLADRAGREVVPVLVFDQFEEIFTRGLAGSQSRAESQRFLTELAELVENRPPETLERAIEVDPGLVEQFRFDRHDYRIVVSVREDFLAAVDGLRSRAPSLGRNRYRLRRMTGAQALDAILNPVPGLIEYDVAREIIRFVGRASPEDAFGTINASDTAEGLEVEPSLLSLVCRELNERRLAQGLNEITADLLAGSRDDIIEGFYERCLAGQSAALRAFVEDELLSASGFRESVTLDTAHRALQDNGVPVAALDELVRRRLLRIEERFDIARVEIIHDVLTTVIRSSRDTRRLRQAEAAAAERAVELRRERRNSRQARLVAATMGALALVTIGLAWWAWHSSNQANQSRRLAEERTKEVASVQLLAAGAMLDSANLQQVPRHALRSLRKYQKRLERLAAEIPNDVDRQRELAVIAFTIGTFTEFQGKPEKNDPLVEFQNYHKITADLASRNPTDPELARDLAASHTVLGEVLETRHQKDAEQQKQDLARALKEFRASSEILAQLAAESASPVRSRELAVSLDRVASVLQEQGELSAALLEWRKYESIMLPLLGERHQDWMSDLADVQLRIGNTLQKVGDLDGAIEAWRKYQALLCGLLKDDPFNPGYNNPLAENHRQVGSVFASRSEFAAALVEHGVALAIYQLLAEKDQVNRASWEQEEVSSHNILGELLRDRGDRAAALAEYRAILTIHQRQSEESPSYSQLQQALSIDRARIGDLLRDEGEISAALAEYQIALDLRRRSAEKDLSYTPWQRDLSVSEPRGDGSDLAAAVAKYRAALDISRGLDTTSLDNSEALRKLLLLYERFGALLLSTKDFPFALDAFEKAESLALRLREMNPTVESTEDLMRVETQLKDIRRSTGGSQAPTSRPRTRDQITPPVSR